jgi:probable HAF family extracellular repeat protein
LIPQLAWSVEFSGLGDLPGGVDTEIQGTVFGPYHSRAYGVSDDGSTVVGTSISESGEEAFRWTLPEGISGLGDLPGGSFNSIASAASYDGTIIVGAGNIDASVEAFRWTETGGMIGLGVLLNSTDDMSRAYDVSSDGSVIVGASGVLAHDPFLNIDAISSPESFIWTESDGMVGLGTLSPEFSSVAQGVSSLGDVVVGFSGPYAFRWTTADGMAALDNLPDHNQAMAFDVSADGEVIVGWTGGSSTPTQAFRWTTSSGMEGLGHLEGGAYPQSIALSTSGDGSVVVGHSSSDKGYEAFIWTADEGMQSLNDYLVANGIDMTGWFLSEARGISNYGTVIVGIGSNPDGNIEGWIVQIDSAPITHTLNLSVNGEGIINSEPGSDMQCTGDCVEEYQEGTIVTLTANPTNNYSFAGWAGDCTGTGDCLVTMDAAKSVTATFLENVPNPVILEGSPGSFTTIQYVYDGLTSGQVAKIKVKAGLQDSENLIFDRDVTLRLEGGYDDIFTNIIGSTSFYGSLTITGGSVTVSDLVIK